MSLPLDLGAAFGGFRAFGLLVVFLLFLAVDFFTAGAGDSGKRSRASMAVESREMCPSRRSPWLALINA